MPYADLLAAGRIVQLATPGGRDEVLDTAARLLGGASAGSARAIAQGLREREALGSTAIGRGVAIPHCRSGIHAGPVAAFLKLAEPVDFGARDGEPVDLVFAMAIPEDDTQLHLDTLSELAGLFADPGFREAVRSAPGLPALRCVLLREAAPPATGRA